MPLIKLNSKGFCCKGLLVRFLIERTALIGKPGISACRIVQISIHTGVIGSYFIWTSTFRFSSHRLSSAGRLGLIKEVGCNGWRSENC